MIDKEIARSLLPFVNGEQYELLQAYVKYRQGILDKGLRFAVNVDDVRDMQGAHKELMILENLRTYVHQDSKKED
jgi:hypothetical protein